jgi:AcrR family transcriptional regulator
MDIREKVLAAAAQVFAETGYRGATTRRIAQVAGVNEVTLFRHFGSKAELMLKALHHFGEAGPWLRLPQDPVDAEAELTRWARENLEHLCEMRAFIRAALGESEEHLELASCGSEQPRRAGGELRAYLERLQERGFATGDFEPGVASAMLLGTLFADAMGRDLMPDVFPLSVGEAAAAYVRLFLRAIGVQVRADPISAA